jgi:integration host factor subunit beta
MNKSDLIAIVAEKTKTPQSRAYRAVDEVFKAMSQALVNGERIELRGFGSWKTKHHRARDGRNPKTGEPISVPERRQPFFSAGKDLSERIMRAWRRAQDEGAE